VANCEQSRLMLSKGSRGWVVFREWAKWTTFMGLSIRLLLRSCTSPFLTLESTTGGCFSSSSDTLEILLNLGKVAIFHVRNCI
jgi:hypothetical protein